LTTGAAFYCVSDASYFLGAVGLVNSLRLLGHEEPVFLLDCGLAHEQREILAPHVTLVDAPPDAPPTLLKTIAPREHPAEVMVLADSDLIVTRPLSDLVASAADGSVVAFRNNMDRFVPEWGELLDLGEVRRHPYLSFAAVFMDGSLGASILEAIAERQARIDFDRGYWGRHDASYALLYADQDVFNATLGARVDPGRIVALDDRLAPTPPFSGLRVIDEASLRCAHADGLEPYVVHHYIVKPWLQPTHHGVYSRLLRRLLLGPDVTVKVPSREIPLRMRAGPLAYLDRKRVNAAERLRWHLREPLSDRLRPRGGGGSGTR
jgi:hypothetical protein